MPTRTEISTEQIITPDTGITLTVKSVQTYGDKRKIYSKVFGSLSVTADGEAPTDVTFAEAYRLATLTILQAITSWDLTEQDGSLTEITEDTLESNLTEADVIFVRDHVNRGEASKKK